MNVEKIMEEVPEYVRPTVEQYIYALKMSASLTVCLILLIALSACLWLMYNFRKGSK